MIKSFFIKSYYILNLLAIIVLFVPVSDANTVIGSKHDFSASNATLEGTPFAGQFGVMMPNGFTETINEVCVFCHTPHGASRDAQSSTLLWNRVSSPPAGYTYKPYTSATFSGNAPDSLNSGKPTGISMMCMSCHDGVTSIAVNTLLNAPGSGNPAIELDSFADLSAPGAIGNMPGFGTFPANIGDRRPGDGNTQIDMSNDHPISFEWVAGRTGIDSPTNNSLRLFGSTGRRIECATCHSVHDDAIVPFLVMSNDQSAMCRSCHLK